MVFVFSETPEFKPPKTPAIHIGLFSPSLIMISEPLMNAKVEDGKWVYWKSQIFNKPFLTVQEGKDKGTPFRTVKSGVWQNGYADHYPTMIYLIKKK